MSWDLDLWLAGQDRETEAPVADWNYTHNLNRVIRWALQITGTGDTSDWWDDFNLMPGLTAAKHLTAVVDELDRDPAHWDQYNPQNGWGSREHLVTVLRDIVATILSYGEQPTIITIGG